MGELQGVRLQGTTVNVVHRTMTKTFPPGNY